ncbi:hypothetical protein JYJ95_42165 [Corallococcus exiguus]|uniref:hypothetical protein n=1 Tax=Corallococcus exiguus TaxID=83462 RepID=UPI001A904DCC|nr:hypothetical protein [Corallococcus exiguus]MBN8473150.1 hypothetical protein [Corallococcus exiguus]
MAMRLKQKMMVLPTVAAAFLMAIVAVTVVLGRAHAEASERIGSSLAPSVSQAQTSRAVFRRVAPGRGRRGGAARGEAGDAGRAGGGAPEGARGAPRVSDVDGPKVEALQGAFTRYLAGGVAGGGAGGAQ